MSPNCTAPASRPNSVLTLCSFVFVFATSSISAQNGGGVTAADAEVDSSVRKAVRVWLRARESIFVPCEGCDGKGVTTVIWTDDGTRGLSSRTRLHDGCGGVGKVLRPAALQVVNGVYLGGAAERPGLVGPPLSEAEIRVQLRADHRPNGPSLARLEGRLGVLHEPADVTNVDIVMRSDFLSCVRVTTSAVPAVTDWVRLDTRWYLVGERDLGRLMADAAGRDAARPGFLAAGPSSLREADARAARRAERSRASGGDTRPHVEPPKPAFPTKWQRFDAWVPTGLNSLKISNARDDVMIVGIRSGGSKVRGLDMEFQPHAKRTVRLPVGQYTLLVHFPSEPDSVYTAGAVVIGPDSAAEVTVGVADGNGRLKKL